MKAGNTTRFAVALTIAFSALVANADSFTELTSVASAGRTHGAGGTFVTVFDENGLPTAERVFLLNGGYPPMLDAEPVADVWILDTEFWHHVTTNAPAMANHTLVALADGRAWAFGGIGAGDWLRPLSAVTSFEVRRIHGRLDVTVEEIQVPNPVPDSCFGQTFVDTDGGRSLFSVGGTCFGNPLNPGPGQLWEYRIDSNRWSRRLDLPVDIANHTAVAARDSLWVFGGTVSGNLSDDVYRYDMLTEEWSLVAIAGDQPGPRRDHRAEAVGNTMLVFGGIEEPFFPETTDEVWQLDLDRLTWVEKTPLPSNLAAMAVDTVPRHISPSTTVQILIYGGVIDAWSFPPDLSDSTIVYTSDTRAISGRASGPPPTSVAD